MTIGQPCKKRKSSPATDVEDCEKKDNNEDMMNGHDVKELTMDTVNIM